MEWLGSILAAVLFIVVVVACIVAVVGGGSYVIGAGIASIAGWSQPAFATWMIGAAIIGVVLFLLAASS